MTVERDQHYIKLTIKEGDTIEEKNSSHRYTFIHHNTGYDFNWVDDGIQLELYIFHIGIW